MRRERGLLIALLVVGIIIAALLAAILAQGELVFIIEGLNGKNGADGADGADGLNGLDGLDGHDGKSAYEIAVENGFEGTVNEWLLSLVVQGAVGKDGVGIENIRIGENGHLLILLTNGRLIDAGNIMEGTPVTPPTPDVEIPDIHMPSQLVMVKGVKSTVCVDQIILERTEDMRVSLTYSGGGTVETVENESISITPAWRNDQDATPHPNETEILLLRLELLIDGKWEQVADRAAIVTVVEKPSSLSQTGLLIGDSRISDGTIAGALGYYSPKISLIGSFQTADGYRHEGRAGWSTEDYLTKSEKGNLKNAFYNPASETFDFSYYMEQQGYDAPDFVVINLGANDNFSQTSVENIGRMVSSIRDYANARGKEIKIFVMTEYLSPTSAMGHTQSYLQGLRAKQFAYYEYLYEAFADREQEEVYLLPNYVAINDTDDFRAASGSSQDVIHLSWNGYYYKEAAMLRAYLYYLFQS